MVFLHVLDVLVGPQGLEIAFSHFALVNGSIRVMLPGMPAHVFGQAEGLAAYFTLVWFLFRVG